MYYANSPRRVPRRQFRLADRNHADVDLTQYEDIILGVIKEFAPNSNPVVTKEYYEINEISQRQRIAIGHELAKAENLGHLSKIVEQVRLFQGHVVTDNSDTADMDDDDDTDSDSDAAEDDTETVEKEENKGGHQ